MRETIRTDTRGNESPSVAPPSPLAPYVGYLVAVIFAVFSVVGITWGLPDRAIDPYLFGTGEVWTGAQISALAGAGDRFSRDVGADVDVDPLERDDREPVHLTETDEQIAQILVRYRLFTHQPDEMITMMALSGMSPGSCQFDPRLYQYGGLFIYPVGALIKACGVVGLIDVRSDLTYYLDHPEQFGRFYLVSRGYAALWGVLGVFVVGWIGRRLGGWRAGGMAALLFACMPVVICMAHEGKPHLPGAVLMLLAVLFAMRCLDQPPRGRPRYDWWLMCASCGAALGMVLSSAPIFILIPLVAWCMRSPALVRTVVGCAVAFGVYLLTNPYILINAVTNRDVLASNFGNSLAMYEIARVWEGLVRVIQLTSEGATPPILVVGIIGGVVAVRQRNRAAWPLLVAGAVFFVQFVAIGAGKPSEYGRFGVFPGVALAIATACLLGHGPASLKLRGRDLAAAVVVLWVLASGLLYLDNLNSDRRLPQRVQRASRILAAHAVAARLDAVGPEARAVVVVVAEPAPYGCPPMDFSRADVVLCTSRGEALKVARAMGGLYLEPVDRAPGSRGVLGGGAPITPISWANKPFMLLDGAKLPVELGPLPRSALPDRLELYSENQDG